MNVTQNNIDALNATLTLKIEKADYEENVSKSLKDYRRKAQMPGFRPGNVPMGMIQKMYGKSLLVDEVFKLVDKGINDYLQEQKLHILGSPIPNEQTPKVDFDTQDAYEFVYDIALPPQVKLELSGKVKIPYYTIKITNEDKQQRKDATLQYFGKMEQQDVVEADDLLRVDVAQEGEEGIKVAGAMLSTKTIAAAQVAKLKGLKVGENITLNIRELLDNDVDCAAFLHLKTEQLPNINPVVTLTIKEVSRMQPAEMNQEFFDKAFGKDVVTNEAEFLAKVETEISEQFARTSDYLFKIDVRKKLLELAHVELPENTLKRWLQLSSASDEKQKLTDEQLEKELPAFFEGLRWSLVQENIAKQNNIQIEESDILESSKSAVRQQFAMYGITNPPDEEVEKYAKNLLQDNKHRSRAAEQILEDKVVDVVKTIVKLDTQEVSKEKVEQLLAKIKEQNHQH
ncbi:trigger factor [Bacteroidia bacterium]|nr:trigger factor [Bacteroidia bacterium]